MKGKEIRIGTLLILDTVFFFLEVIIGYSVHSLALIADSFHMLNDIFSLVIALWAVRVTKYRSPNAEYTYGWQRAEILGALVNAVFLLALCFSIVIEAIQRFFEPQEIKNPQLILIVGITGLISNFVGLLLFHEHGHGHSHSHSHSHGTAGNSHNHDHKHAHNLEEQHHGEDFLIPDLEQGGHMEPDLPDVIVNQVADERSALLRYQTSPYHRRELSHHQEATSSTPEQKASKSLNMRGVFLHVLGDALGNIGVIATALFIWRTQYSWRFYTDPIVSLFITLIIFSTALPLCQAACKILLQATPESIDTETVHQEIEAIAGVHSIHDLHIWILRENMFIASLHIAVSSDPNEFMTLAKKIRVVLHNYGIHSATIQPEFTDAQYLTDREDSNTDASSDISGPHDTRRQDSCSTLRRYAATSEEFDECLVDAELVRSDHCPKNKS